MIREVVILKSLTRISQPAKKNVILLTRQMTRYGFMNTFIWRRIYVKDFYVIRNKADRQLMRKWVESKSHRACTYKEAGAEFVDLPDEDRWMSLRCRRQEFVNEVKERKTPYLVGGEYCINRMKMIDIAYVKN
jgi:hypothetical protein